MKKDVIYKGCLQESRRNAVICIFSVYIAKEGTRKINSMGSICLFEEDKMANTLFLWRQLESSLKINTISVKLI